MLQWMQQKGDVMKKLLIIGFSLLLLACAEPNDTPQTPEAIMPTEIAAPEADAAPEIRRFPVTEAIAPLPNAVESVDLGDRLLRYSANGMSYLYLHGESIPLHAGAYFGTGIYNYLQAGTTFVFFDPNDGTLRRLDLTDPHKEPVAVAPELIGGVKRFAVSEDGNTVLFLKQEGQYEQVDEPIEALYLYADGEVTRIAESEGDVDQFYLSPDGKSMVFYVDVYENTDLTFADYLILDGGEPFSIPGIVDSISEDLRTVLIKNDNTLTLFRAGEEPLLLSEQCSSVEHTADDGECWWTDNTPYEALWHFDGKETKKIGNHMGTPRITSTGAYAFFRNDTFWAQFGDGEPVRICSRAEFAGARFAEDERTLLYMTVSDRAEDWLAHAHCAAYAVTVDETGISEPVLRAEDCYFCFAFRDGQLSVRSKDLSLCDLYYNDWLLGTDVRFWSNTRYHMDPAHQNLFFISEGRLYQFDGQTLKAILETDPADDAFPFHYLENGTFTYQDGDVLYYYDGAAFHRIAEQVADSGFIATREAVAEERDLHD